RGERASREMMHVCGAAGGTITGEHGVGYDKREYMDLVFSETTLEAMCDVRRVFNPRGLANPGKVFPVRVCREWAGPATVVQRVEAAERQTAGGGEGGPCTPLPSPGGGGGTAGRTAGGGTPA